MAFPSRTLRAVCEISSGTLQISQRPPAYTHEEGALSVIVDLKNNGAAYVPDASVVAGMYLFWQDTQYMSELVEMGISGCTLSGTFSGALTAMPGCPMLVIQLQDTDTSDIIVAAAAPIQITKIEGNLIVTTRPPSPSEIIYIGRSPYINSLNGHWMQWNSTDHAYEDTGVVARGVPATFTATAQGLPAGSTPTATITGTAENPVINLGIPKGDTGDTGATGPAAGFGTIAATVDNTSGTPGVTVNTSGPDTAKNMTFAFTGLKGAQGDPGPVQQVCGVSPNSQGNVLLKGTDIPLQTMSLVTVKQAIDNVGATFTGATSSTAGTKGQTPAPAAGDEEKLLTGAGTWEKITGSDLEASSSDTTKIATVLSNLNDQKADQGTLAPEYNGATAPAGGIPGNSFFYHNGALCFTPSPIAQDTSIPSGIEVVGLNNIQNMLNVDSVNNGSVTVYKIGNIKILTGAPYISGNNEWVNITTIPVQYAPQSQTFAIAAGYVTDTFAIILTASGSLRVFIPTQVTNQQVFINMVYT